MRRRALDENLKSTATTVESRIWRCILLTDRERASKSCDSSQKARGEQQKAEGGEGQASQMRHALPDEVIHQHTYYAVRERARTQSMLLVAMTMPRFQNLRTN